MEGSWHKDDIRRVFVAGAKWWEWKSRDATMWNSDVRRAEAEATKRYPPPCCDDPGKEKCDQCQEQGLADPKNQG